MAKVTMPQLGESVAEGTIGKWLKKPGDHVAKYEPLLEVITDKVNAEVPSPFEGVLKEILAEEAFDYLDGPVTRIAGPEVPGVPYNHVLEDWFMVNPEKIADGIRTLAAY